MKQHRGLTKDGKKWVYGSYCNLAGLSYIAEYPVGAGYNADGKIIGGWTQVTQKTVGQQVGLTDKDDKDLDWWEGDYLQDNIWTYLIVKDVGCFWSEEVKSKRRMLLYLLAQRKTLALPKVIGNIHQR